ncbi:MAG: FimV/HubP family polar landmark protein, partial [Woeseiaceae bacterium]
MVRNEKLAQSLAAGLAGFLLTCVVWAQDVRPVADARAGLSTGESAVRIDVKGVLVSPRNRSVLINGRVFKVGDQIGGIEIAAIDQHEVRLRKGSRETGVSVGTSWSIDQLHWSPVTPDLTEPVESQVAVVLEMPPEPISTKEFSRQHEVGSGETLSEIAESYLVPGVKRYQLMVALFEANPHAFNGNINRMRAGVVLNIPSTDSLAKLSPRTAMAKVMEQTDRWRSERPRQATRSEPVVADTYGPVSSGETLSLIAHRLSQEGGNAGAMMSALYRANPHAFGDNM